MNECEGNNNNKVSFEDIYLYVPSYLYICMVVKYVAKNVRFEGNNNS